MRYTSDRNKLLQERILVGLSNISYTIDVYDTPLGKRWLEALKDNLEQKRILEKNFCFLGFADSKRNLNYLVTELNKSINQINSFEFYPPYNKIHPFVADDFQYSNNLPIGIDDQNMGLRLKHESCNLLHRHFEELQGTAWKLSNFYKQADVETKYAIRQLNNLCHEIESWVLSYRKKVINPEWIRPTQITTFLNAPRYDLHEDDYQLFKLNRYRRELGGVYLHWSQIGKTLYEVFRDEGGVQMNEATCSEINHQKYYSGEFDIEWGQTIDENTFEWKKHEMARYRQWLKSNGYDWEDKKLALGYIKIGQVDLAGSFNGETSFEKIYAAISDNLNITKIEIQSSTSVKCEYPYSLDSEDWREIQMKGLRRGYGKR